MKLELNNRSKILLGVVVLIGALAAAWFLYLEEMLMGPATAPVASAPKPAAAPAKPGADAAKPAADAAKPAAQPVAGAKPAAQPAAPAAANPDQVIAAVMDASGLTTNLAKFGAEFAAGASAGIPGIGAADLKAVTALGERIYEPKRLSADISASLKKSYDAERMPKFLDLLKQPVHVKMVGYETRSTNPAELKQFMSGYDRNKPTPERARLVARIDNATKSTELITEVTLAMARVTAERMIEEMEKAGARLPASARQQMSNELLSQKDKMRGEFFKMLHFTYRGVPDAELEEYVKLIDTDIGRWGGLQLHNALRTALEPRSRELAREIMQLAVASQASAKPTPVAAAAQPAAPVSEAPAAAAEKPAAEPAKAAAAPVKPAPAPAYRRPDNLPELYKKYNDIITAVVMRDPAAASELLDDGKNPNARQSDGQTALMIAAGNGDMQMIKLLLDKGADPNLRGPHGLSAFSVAKETGRADLLKLLESHGAKP
jgi:hypothetical protein